MGMRLVFMGTPEFALPSLKAVSQSSHTLLAVVTQPDRSRGRGGRLAEPPAKIMAGQLGLPVLQPEKIKDPVFLEALWDLRPDAIAVAAFGRILPPVVLEIPPRGCINLHASLLPKYRGAAPIQWAIIRGENETGLTTIRMDAGMDTGDILLQERLPILPEDTAGSLSIRMAVRGADLLIRTLDGIESGGIVPSPQNSSEASLAPVLEKEAGEIDWSRGGMEIANRIRGLDPWPGSYTYYEAERWKIWKVRPAPDSSREAPGTIVGIAPEGIAVATGREILTLLELQPASGRRMSVRQFLAGHPVKIGRCLAGGPRP